jgi:plastocyanin
MRLLVVLVALGCGSEDSKAIDAPRPIDGRIVDAGPDAPPDAATEVRVVNCAGANPVAMVTSEDGTDAFMPVGTTITVNQVVQFEMAPTHNVVPVASDPGLTVGFGQTKCLQFTATGTQNFKCAPHGFTGSITVN